MAWLNPNWQYRSRLTVRSDYINSDLTDFPVFVNLAHLSPAAFAEINSDGSDIRITEADGVTELPFELVEIDTLAGTGELHFKVSGTLSSTVDTSFYIYYGNSFALPYDETATFGKHNVWTNGFVAVYHLNEIPGTTAFDSTAGSYDGAFTGSMTSADSVSAIIGKGIYFDGVNDFIDVADMNVDFETAGLTVSAWAKYESIASYARILDFGQGRADDNFILGRHGTTTNVIFEVFNGGAGLQFNSAFGIALDTWFRVDAVTTSGTSASVYKDGSLLATGTIRGRPKNVLRNLNYIARSNWAADAYFNGVLDEIRISNVERSASWISSEYNNQQNPQLFYTISSIPENNPLSTVDCPTNFVLIPGSEGVDSFGNPDPLYAAGWCVSQYEMTPINTSLWVRDGAFGWHYVNSSGAGKAITSRGGADSFPITQITRNEAALACANNLYDKFGNRILGGKLPTVYMWQKISQLIVDDGINWSGGTPGSGNLSRGNANSAGPLAGVTEGYEAVQPITGTFYYTGNQGRAWRMGESKGSVYDWAGNVWEWFDDLHNNATGASFKNINASILAYEHDNPNGPSNVSVIPTEFATHDNTSNGVGMIFVNSTPLISGTTHAAIFGGLWSLTANAGVFTSYWGNFSPSGTRSSNIGFRCIIPANALVRQNNIFYGNMF